ncbi:MOSC domain-containing protein [Sporichthya polymorpha]|uniref:MOSC domain-containing protein n=1 Tax=Sporichthya polymorpha TaxID=35751 RepID=UPI0003729017|nr:MOSC N-terminal beta barrel domain-containing protein [Sporichthya polymorpha]
MTEVGRITQIWRFPVKSMAGERLSAVDVDARGVHADRMWAVRDVELKATTSAKRLPSLMLLSARYATPPPADAGPGNAPEAVITFPDGSEIATTDPGVHKALSTFLDRDVELRPLPAVTDKKGYRGPLLTKADIRTVMGLDPDEPLPDLSMFPVRTLAELTRYVTPVGTYADVYPLHLLTEQSMATMEKLTPTSTWDVRRFRPSLLAEARSSADHPEWQWCGSTVRAGTANLEWLFPTIRCRMPGHEQLGLPQDRDVVRTISAHARRCLGVYGTVAQPGRVAEGDALTVVATERPPLGARPDALAARVKRRALKAGQIAIPRGRAR